MEEIGFFGSSAAGLARTVEQLRGLNVRTARFGLTLTEEEMAALAAGRSKALRDAGRVELGDGMLPALAEAFCDSPYLQQTEYAGTLQTLQEIFYWFKTESRDRWTDEELLALLRRAYDGKAGGAAEYLAGMTAEELCGEAAEEDSDES